MAIRVCAIPFCEEGFKSDDFTRFYTELPNIGIAKSVFTTGTFYTLLEWDESGWRCKINTLQEFISTLIELRTNAAIDDLGYRLNVSNATISRTFIKWIKQLEMKLKGLIWSDREALQKSTPRCF